MEHVPCESLGYLLSHASRSLNACLNAMFVRGGHRVTAEQWKILQHLWTKDGVPQKELASMIGRDETMTTRFIDGLEKGDYVVRIPDQKDRRRKRIYLTRKGRSSKEVLNRLARENLEEACLGLSEREVERLKAGLRSIMQNLKNKKA